MRYRLSDVCTLIGGGTPKTTVKEYWGGDIPWLSVKDFINGEKYVYQTEKHITEEGLLNSATTLLQPDDIILSARGTVGEMAVIPFPMAFNQSCYGVRAKKDIITSDYLYYLLKQKVGELKHNAHGSVFDTITRDTFAGIEIELPNIQRQKRVSKILSSFDAKIEMNTRINHNLQQQFQALFDSWFKRFEPFSQPKYESELGLIPEGWGIKDIYSISSIIYGAPFSSKLFKDEHNGAPIVRIRDLKTQNTSTYTTEIHPKGYLIKNGDIVVGMDGEFRPYIWGSGEAWLNQRVCVFENKRPKGKVFLYCSIKPLLNLIEQTEVATTVIQIGKQDFDAFRIVMPPIEILNAFDDITAPMYNRIVNNIMENHRHSALRDTLLPRLMSGEIDVSEVEI